MSTDSRRAVRASRRVTGGVGFALVAASVATAAPAEARDHVVKPGDTVSHLALRYGTTTKAIIAANRLNRSALIRVGETLTIPESTSASPAPAPTAPRRRRADADHRALHGALRRHRLPHRRPLPHHRRRRHRRQRSRLPRVHPRRPDAEGAHHAGRGSTASTDAHRAGTRKPRRPAVRYTVRSGDTVSHIAARYSTTVAAVIAANGLDSRAFIRAGQTLTVPASTGTSGAQPVTSGLVGSTFAGPHLPRRDRRLGQPEQGDAARDRRALRARRCRRWWSRRRAKYGVDPALAQAVAYQESGFNHASVSPANAIGCMQVIPSSGEWASDLVGRDLNLLDPQDNVTAGVVILRQLLRSAGDTSTAIAGYYQGLSSVRSNGMFADTRRYVANVRTLMSRFA